MGVAFAVCCDSNREGMRSEKLLHDYLAWKYRTCLLVYLKSDLPVAYKAFGTKTNTVAKCRQTLTKCKPAEDKHPRGRGKPHQ